MAPLKIARGVQNLHRLQRIARVLTQHGFGHVVDQLDLGRFVPARLKRFSKKDKVDEHQPASVGRRLKQVASDLGPIFVKLGQMLATRPDMVPPDILNELRTLQDHVEPFDSQVAKEIIRDELHQPVAQAFASVDEQPIASGSIGQVYRATLPGGRHVVIKVRRPDIEPEIRADLQLLRWLAEALEHWVSESRAYHPTVLVDEFERTLLNELDLMHEAATTARLHQAFRDDAQIEVPEVIWSHTTSKVLTLQAISGLNIDQALETDGNQLDRKRLAGRLADMYFRQFFEIGTFHADPHPGNILVTPPARVGLIDFGQTGMINDATAGHLLILLIGVVTRDVEIVADTLTDMGACGTGTDRNQLMRDLQFLLDKYDGQPIRRLKMATLFSEAADTIRRHNLSIPRDVVLMLKCLATIWGVALRLDPDLDIAALMRLRLRAMVRERLSPGRMARSAGVTMWHFLSFVKSAPQQLREVLRQVSSGKWQVNVRHENLEPLAREVDRSGNRLAFAIVIAAVVLGSSMVVTSQTSMEVLGIRLQTFGFFGYLVAGVLGMGLLIAILRSGRLS